MVTAVVTVAVAAVEDHVIAASVTVTVVRRRVAARWYSFIIRVNDHQQERKTDDDYDNDD